MMINYLQTRIKSDRIAKHFFLTIIWKIVTTRVNQFPVVLVAIIKLSKLFILFELEAHMGLFEDEGQASVSLPVLSVARAGASPSHQTWEHFRHQDQG